MNRRFLPKLGPRLSRRNTNLFSKKAPKTRKAVLIAFGLGVLTGAGYVITEKIAEHREERAARIAEAREQIRGVNQFSIDQEIKRETSDAVSESIDL